jgi:hypothetical protein
MTGAAVVGVAAVGVGVGVGVGGGVLSVGVGGVGAGGGASDISTASTVFSVIRTTCCANPELMAHHSKPCNNTTSARLANSLRGERWRAAYVEEGAGET